MQSRRAVPFLVALFFCHSPCPGQEAGARPTCALLPFANMTSRPESAYLAGVILQSLYPSMERTGAWIPIERARLRELLAESDLVASNITPGRPIQLLEAQLVVLGEYRDDGGLVTVTARLVEAKTGVVVRQAVWKGHVSGMGSDMAPWIAAALADKPSPDGKLTAELQDLFERACRDLTKKRPDKVIALCDRILDKRRRHLPTLLLRAHAYLLKKGQSYQATKDFNRVLEIDPDVVAAKIGLARIRLMGDERSVVKALDYLQDVLEANSENGEVLWLAALSHEALNHSREAMDYANRATRALPQFAPAWETLARLQLAADSVQPAMKSAVTATTYAPQDPAVWMLLGDVQLRAQDIVEARKSFNKAIGLDPPADLKRALNTRLNQRE